MNECNASILYATVTDTKVIEVSNTTLGKDISTFKQLQHYNYLVSCSFVHSADEDVYLEVVDAVSQLHDRWSQLCCALGLPLSQISTIRKDHAGNTMDSLQEGISQWLQGKYNTDKHGPPTWKKLVAAIDNPVGGNNHDLAMKISVQHKGT